MDEGKPIREVLQRIAFECQESGATKWQALKILRGLEAFQGSESQLRRKAAEILEKLNPEAAKTFVSFEKMRVYTSARNLEPFDRGNIIKSLLRETGISRHVAEKIGSEVEDKIKDLNIAYLNTQIIREMVNVKLLEYGHEAVHSQYARIGLPAYEIRKKMGSRETMAVEMMAEYSWLAEIPAKARELHFESVIHVFAPEDFSEKIYGAAKFVPGSPEDSALESRKEDAVCSEPLTLRAFNFACASGGGAKKGVMGECARAGKIFSLAGKPRFAELALFTDSEWQGVQAKKGDAVRIANAFLRGGFPAGANGLKFYASVDSKYQLKLLRDYWPAEGNVLIANSARGKTKIIGAAALTGDHSGIMQFTGINLGKMSEAAGGAEERLLERMAEAIDAVGWMCRAKREALAKRPHSEKLIGDSVDAVCLSGLAEAASGVDAENAPAAAERIIQEFQKAGFAVCENTDAEALRRFGARENRRETQKLLLEMGQKAKRAYGFRYSAETLKEAEALIAECPLVGLGAKPAPHSP